MTELKTTCESVSNTTKPKGFIHWVSSPLSCEIRIYERLYVHKFAFILFVCNQKLGYVNKLLSYLVKPEIKLQCVPKKGYLLKSSANTKLSNLNVLTLK